MSTPPPTDRAALARERLAERARRLSLLRRRVVAAALATFALAWGVIAFHGPMGQATPTPTTASTQTTQSTSASDGSTTTDDSSSSDDSSASSSDDSSSQDTAPVTTSQS